MQRVREETVRALSTSSVKELAITGKKKVWGISAHYRLSEQQKGCLG